MTKILITGAGSGLGEGAAIGIARNGHQVIAAAQTWPQDGPAARETGECRRSRQTTLVTQTRHQQTNPFEKAKLSQRAPMALTASSRSAPSRTDRFQH
jgi:NAD(P)-dependent dehydrogenase (short-subunit alcohol dehydrogenase family)